MATYKIKESMDIHAPSIFKNLESCEAINRGDFVHVDTVNNDNFLLAKVIGKIFYYDESYLVIELV